MPYIGQRPSKGDENNFKILDDISSYTLTFDGSDSSVVSVANDTITSLNHRFVQGQRVLYHHGGGGSNIGGLGNNTPYFVIKEDHNTIKLATTASNASNGVAINITGVGGGSSHTLNVAFDGINTKFKATHSNGVKAKVTRSAQLVISINGVIQQPHDTATPSTGFGFDLDGTIVLSQAPASTDIFWAHVLTNNNVTFDISDNDLDSFTGDGNTIVFNLSKTPPDNRNVLVTIDGVVQRPNDPDGTTRAYSVVENVLTFASAPASGTEIQVRHIGFAGSVTGGSVTNFYGRTGNAVLKSTDNIVVGDANITGNLTVEGDFTTLNTTLREVELLRVDANSTAPAGIITQRGSGDILKLYDGASQVVTVGAGGSVGIGTDDPSSPLQVYGDIKITNDAGGSIQSNGLRTTPDGKLQLLRNNPTNNTPVITIDDDNGGLVGIGTTIPTQILHILDSNPIIQFTDTNGLGSRINAESGNLYLDTHNENRDIIFRGGNSSTDEVARITGDGLVGIGTNAPNAPLHVEKNGTSEVIARFESNYGSQVSRHVSLTSPTGNSASLPFTFSTGNSFEFNCDDHTGLHINSDGRVGIHTRTVPTQGICFVGIQTVSSNYNTEPTVRFAAEANKSGVHGDVSSVHIGQRAAGSADPAIIFHRRSGDVAWKSWSARIHQGGLDGLRFGFAPAALPGYHSYTDEMTIKRSIGVGIGTPTPKTKLNVYTHPHTDTGGILVQNANYTSDLDKAYLIAGTQNWTGAATDWNTYGFQHKLKSDGVGIPRLTIDTSAGGSNLIEIISFMTTGKVGIGTNNPNVSLEVLNNSPGLRLTDNDSSVGSLSYTQLTNINGNTYVYTRANSNNGNYLIGGQGGGVFDEFVRITSNGRIGIGTANPDQELHVVGQIKVDDSNYARVEYASNDTNLWSVGLRDTDDFWFFRESGAANVIFQHGKVGIGSTIPSEKLDVAGHIKVDNGPVLENSDTGGVLRVTSATGYLDVGSKNSSYAHFGTNRAKYYFNKRIIIDEGIIGSYNDDLILHTDITEERVRIKNDTGFVGIGTDVPASELHVFTEIGDCILTLESDKSNNSSNENDNPYIVFKQDGSVSNSAIGINPNSVNSESNSLVLVNGTGSGGIYFKTGTSGSISSGTVERLKIEPTGEIKINNGGKLIFDTYMPQANDVSEAIRIDDQGGTGDRALQFFEVRQSGARHHRIQFNLNSSSDGTNYYHTQGNYGGSSVMEFGNSGQIRFFTMAQVSAGSTDNISLSERLEINSSGYLTHTATDSTISLVETQNVSQAGTKIAFFGANRSDTDEEFAAIKGLLTSNSGGSGKQNGGLQFIIGSASHTHTMAQGGYVGIGTGNPQALLHLQGEGGGNTQGIYFKNGPYDVVRQYFANGNDNSDFVITYDGTGGAEITLKQTGNLVLNESNGGNVGLGQAIPSEKLHVAGSIKLTAQLMQSMPADFWSQSNTFIELNGIGNITHMGGYETNITSNGYRDDNGQWVSYNTNSQDGAAQIGLTPTGEIRFRTDASKADGTAHNPTLRALIDDTGRVRIGSNSGTEYSISNDSNAILQLSHASGPKIILTRVDGSVSGNDYLGVIDFHSTDPSNNLCSRIGVTAAQSHTSTTRGTDFRFLTTKNGTTTQREVMRINDNGALTLNSTGTSDNAILLVSSEGIETRHNTANQTAYALKVDSHHTGGDTLTSGRAHGGAFFDVECGITTGANTPTSQRIGFYGIRNHSTATKYVYTNYGLYSLAQMTKDVNNQMGTSTVVGVYGYAQGYQTGGTNKTANIYGGYFLGYRGGDVNAGHCFGVHARAHNQSYSNTTNASGNTGDMTGVYAECESDQGGVTINNMYAFRGHLDRDSGTITTGYMFYGSFAGDSAFGVRRGIWIEDSQDNYLGGSLTITGDLNANSGTKNFRIAHPLVGLSTTKDLVHAAIEGPQVDLIYRGKVDLVNGTATVNLDTKSGMTEGTFVALTRDVQCFTTNETGWTNVKGSVTGNQLTIIAQENTCTDTISWMVIGERQDDAVKQSGNTDADGKLILEPNRRTDLNPKYKADNDADDQEADELEE